MVFRDCGRGPGLTSSGEDASDDFDRSRAGFRADWKTDQDNAFTAQGDITTVRSGEIATVFEPVAPFARTLDERGRLLNADLLARWTRTLSATSEISLQTYYTNSKLEG